jgi:hypothetical protein
MPKRRDSDDHKTPGPLPLAYVFAAAIIWILIWYDGSSLNHPLPARLPAMMIQACEHAQP